MARGNEILRDLQNFTLRVQAFPAHFSVLRAGPELQPYLFGGVTFTTKHAESTQPLEWKANLIGIKEERKLVLTLHLLTAPPAEKLDYIYNLSSSLQRFPSGYPSMKTIRFGEDQLETYRNPTRVFEWDFAALENMTDYLIGQSGLLDLNVSMRITERSLPMLIPHPARGPLNHEEYFVGETDHSDAYDGPFLLELHTADGIVKTHKHVLAAESPYIKHLINGASLLDDQVYKLFFPTVSTKVMKQVVNFIYFGRLDKGWESVYGDIIGISSKLGLLKLLQVFAFGPSMNYVPQIKNL